MSDKIKEIIEEIEAIKVKLGEEIAQQEKIEKLHKKFQKSDL